MKLVLLTAYVCLFIYEPVRSQTFEKDDQALLQDLLRQSKEQNRKLEQQMKRMKLMWSGMQQMCSALEANTCDCKESEQPDQPEQSVVPEVGSNSSVTLLRVASSGLNDDGSIELTIDYMAGEDHYLNIMVPYHSEKYGKYDLYRPPFQKVKKDKEIYSANVHFPNLKDAQAIFLMLHSGRRGISIEIDVSVAQNVTEQTVGAFESSVVKLDYKQPAPVDDNLTVSVVVDEDARDPFILEHANVEMNGLDTKSNPPKVFEIGTYIGNNIKLSGNRKTDTTSWLNATILEYYASFGGYVSILLPLKAFKEKAELLRINTDLIPKIFEVHIVEIMLPDSNKVVPDKTVGLYPQSNQIQVFQEKRTISCMAMGNPPPVVSIHKNVNGDRKKEMDVQRFSIEPNLHIASYTVDKNDLRSPKTFTCRAKSGSAFVEDTIEAKALIITPVKFDMAKTGVIKNTSEEVVFGCKAKWKTNPELTFHLYESSGPLLDDGEDFAVVSKRIGQKATKLTMTVSPRNEGIHTVLCLAKVPWDESIRIEVYPGVQKEWDWTLYSKLLSHEQQKKGNTTYDYEYN